ncbi:MAG: ATP-dependent DNA helicase, partial [Salinigranum sp.]
QAQVDRLSRPDLPEFDPAAALGGVDAERATGGRAADRGGASGGAKRTRGRSGRTANGSSRRTGRHSGRERSGDGSNHPLSDVWGE